MNTQTRVVFLVDLDNRKAQLRVLDWLDRLGAHLVALVGPESWREAHAMIGNGEADLIVTDDHDTLPGVVVASTATMQSTSRAGGLGRSGGVRPEMVHRGGLGAVVDRPAARPRFGVR
ncbi:hypothetical protein JNW88_29745 [Micromonospora sp. ATA32]|nr:hypothetical protein [Micromonospora sp. ATA32]